MIVVERRASSILFHFLTSVEQRKPLLLPANVCPIVPITLMKARTGFTFVDISPDTLCMDEEATLAMLRTNPDRYGGIVYVRSYGFVRNVEAFFEAVKEISAELLVIDDRCLAAPSFDAPTGTCSDLTLYSTGYSKYVDLGWGGFAFLADRHKYSRTPIPYKVRDLETITGQYKACLEGRSRFQYSDSDWLDSDAPNEPLARYREIVERKAKESARHKSSLNRIYREMLPETAQLPAEYQEWRFNIFSLRKEELLSAIFDAGLFASSHYASLDGVFSSGRSLGAEAFHARIVNLFNDRYFTEEQAIQVTEIVRRHLARSH